MTDQALSALSNLLLSVLVARSLDAAGFASFAVALLVYGVVLELTRAAIGQPLQITSAGDDLDGLRASAGFALASATVAGVVAGGGALFVAWIAGGEIGVAILVLGIWLPGLVVQDVCRSAFFAARQPARAAAIDALWTVIVIGGCSIAISAGAADRVGVPLLLWGIGAALSAVWGMWLLRTPPRLAGSIGWMRDRWSLGKYLSAEYALVLGLGQAGILAVGAVDSIGVGAIRAAQMLLGPANVLGVAVLVFATTETARRSNAARRELLTMAAGPSALVGVVVGTYCVVLLTVPDSWGGALLGDSWAGATSVLLPMSLMAVAAAFGTGVGATLYGTSRTSLTFRLNAIRAALLTALFAVAIPRSGAVGAAWALAATEIVMVPIWWGQLWLVLSTADSKRTATVVAGSMEAK